MLILTSRQFDPYWNLAVEDLLLDQVGEHRRILFLWQSDHSVVVGKNQNPWRECSLGQLREARGLLARRVTGGGAVYHDRGNLNFASFEPREHYSEAATFAWVCSALKRVGVPAERLGRNGLGVGGRKFSGNAFCFRRNSALHHGTVLVSSDLGRLDRVLQNNDAAVETRAIPSIPAEVVNLRDIVPDVTVDDVKRAFITEFASLNEVPADARDAGLLDSAKLRQLHHRYVSWEWCFGHTPPFTIVLTNDFSWGQGAFRFTIEKGHVQDLEITPADLPGTSADEVRERLLTRAFKESALAIALRTRPSHADYATLNEIATWLRGLPLS